MAITNFRAFWHPGTNNRGIEIVLQNGQRTQIQTDSAEEFIAVLAILNGPNPTFQNGHVVCQR